MTAVVANPRVVTELYRLRLEIRALKHFSDLIREVDCWTQADVASLCTLISLLNERAGEVIESITSQPQAEFEDSNLT